MPDDHQIRRVKFGDEEFLIPSNSMIRGDEVPDEYQKLVRRTFEQSRDIGYQKFHREFFDSARAQEKYPDPAVREEAMRHHWIVDYEDRWLQHMFSHPLDEGELQRQSDMMRRIVAEHGDRAWHVLADEKEILDIERRRLARMGPAQEAEARRDGPLDRARERTRGARPGQGRSKGPDIG